MRKLYVLTILGSIGISACGSEDEGTPAPVATGGTSTGGAKATGGAVASGGTVATGGTTPTGGTKSTAGAAGSSGAGGAKGGAGGTAGAGGTSGGAGGIAAGGSGGTAGSGGAKGGAGGTSGSGGASGGAGKGGGGAGGAIGGAGGGGSGGGSAATFKAVAAIIDANCATGGCHGPKGAHTDFETTGTLRTNLLGVPQGTNGKGGSCAGKSIVVPSMPEKSLLYTLVVDGTPCASKMPFMCGKAPNPDCLKAADIQTIRDWITAGAPE